MWMQLSVWRIKWPLLLIMVLSCLGTEVWSIASCMCMQFDYALQAYNYTAGPEQITEKTGAANPFNGVDVGEGASPLCGDVDGDGDLDWCAWGVRSVEATVADLAVLCVCTCVCSFIGARDGTINYFRNWALESFCNHVGAFALTSERCLCPPGYADLQCKTVR